MSRIIFIVFIISPLIIVYSKKLTQSIIFLKKYKKTIDKTHNRSYNSHIVKKREYSEVKAMNEDLRYFVEACLALTDEQRKMVASFINGLQIGAERVVDRTA